MEQAWGRGQKSRPAGLVSGQDFTLEKQQLGILHRTIGTEMAGRGFSKMASIVGLVGFLPLLECPWYHGNISLLIAPVATGPMNSTWEASIPRDDQMLWAQSL